MYTDHYCLLLLYWYNPVSLIIYYYIAYYYIIVEPMNTVPNCVYPYDQGVSIPL